MEVSGIEQAEYFCVATFLPLRRWSAVVPFLRLSSRIGRQLLKSDGAVRFGMRTDLPRRRFWTLSVWRDRDSMRAFVGAEPHRTAARKFGSWAAGGAAFVEYVSGSGRIDWAEADRRLQTPTFYFNRNERRPS